MAVTQALALQRNVLTGVLPITGFPAYVNHRTAAAAETETVPAGAARVVITADADVWLSDGTAAVPVGDVVDGTGSFLLAAKATRAFFVTVGQTISFVPATGTVHIGFEYYSADVRA